jgi:hypothetical protein
MDKKPIKVRLTLQYEAEVSDFDELQEALNEGEDQYIFEAFGIGHECPSHSEIKPVTPKNTTPGHVEPLTQTYAITFKDSDKTITVEIVGYEMKNGFLNLFERKMFEGRAVDWDVFASYSLDNIKQIVKQKVFTEDEVMSQIRESSNIVA